MKLHKITSLFVFALACFATSAQPKAEWVSTSHYYGIINENDGDAKCTFTLINTGDSPLVITNARATCGCTRPKYSKEAIAPGDSMTISVSYDPVGRPGRFKKKIYIDTNTEPKRSTLEISGVVIASEKTIKRFQEKSSLVLYDESYESSWGKINWCKTPIDLVK